MENMNKVLEYYLQEGKIKQECNGIYEIYSTKFNNSDVLNNLLHYFCNNGYTVIKITNNWIRAMR